MVELRIFWKIVIDTTCVKRKGYRVRDVVSDVVKKEVGVWGNDNGVWHRYLWRRFNLAAEVGGAQKGQCSVSCDEFCLTDCYLRISDPGLKAQARELMSDVGTMEEFAVSASIVEDFLMRLIDGQAVGPMKAPQFVIIDRELYYVGRNIMLSAEFRAESEGAHSLFEFPMYRPLLGRSVLHRPIVVKEFKANGTGRRSALWHLSRNMLYFSHAYSVSDHHVLTVSQDQNVVVTEASVDYQGSPYFEFLLDSIPIRRPAIDKHEHLFDTGPIEFYVGYSPSKGGQLDGCVRRIVFDPNASCLGCTM